MLYEYEPIVKTTIEFLRLLKVKVNNSTVNEVLQDHPEWPSLLCISDSLNTWNIPNGSGKIDNKKIDELPIPFIAYTKDIGNPLSIITEISDTTIYEYSGRYSKPTGQRREDFLAKWDGIYLIAEPTGHSGEANFQINKTKKINNVSDYRWGYCYINSSFFH